MSFKEKLDNSEKTQRPKMWKVIIHDDDYTPFDFVVELLETIFRKPHAEAENLALEVHTSGAAVVGVYTRDVAETKATHAMSVVQKAEHPLMVLAEPN